MNEAVNQQGSGEKTEFWPCLLLNGGKAQKVHVCLKKSGPQIVKGFHFLTLWMYIHYIYLQYIYIHMYMYIMYIYFDIFYLASYSQIIFVSSYGLLRLN